MKVVLILLIPLFSIAQSSYYPETQKVYTYHANVNVTYILKLLDSSYYEFFKCNKSKVEYDFGNYRIYDKDEFYLESAYIKDRFNFLIYEDKLLINERGIYPSQLAKIRNKNELMKIAANSDYDKAYDFNYITDTICNELSEFRLGRTNPSINKAKELFIKQAMEISPDYADILKKYYCGPGYYTSYIGDQKIKWDNDLSETSLNKLSGTVLHESVHGFNRLEYDTVSRQWLHWFCIGPGKNIKVKYYKYYHSRHFYPIIPKIVKDSVFRYQTYVGIKAKTMGSNVRGILGLMNEYTAYMNDARISLDLFNKAYKKNDTINSKVFLHAVADVFSAYYQFNLFIAYYLKYGKDKAKKSYEAAFENKNLRIAYTVATKEFKSIVDEFYAIIEAQPELKDRYVAYRLSEINVEKEYLEKEKSILEAFKVTDLTPEIYVRNVDVAKSK